MPFPLETDRLILRQFRDTDLDEFLAYRSDPRVARYQGWDVPYEREKGLTFRGGDEESPTRHSRKVVSGSH